jgi:hypothetical protein
MTGRRARRVLELSLRAYPGSFRAEYGRDILQLFDDRLRDGSVGPWHLCLSETLDVLRNAAIMRMEHPMNKLALVTVGLFAAVVVTLAIGPLALVPLGIALAGLMVWLARHDAPVSRPSGSRGAWILVGLLLLAGAVGISVAADGELSEPAWALFAVLGLGGLALTVLGVATVLGAGRGPATTRR